jgi:hypothetical protein
MDIADRLFDELNSPDSIEARRRIFLNLHEAPEIGLKKLRLFSSSRGYPLTV